MSLSKKYVRDGKNRIIASITSGYSDTSWAAQTSVSRQCVMHTATWYPSIHPIPVC
jgi:hypothetical protein